MREVACWKHATIIKLIVACFQHAVIREAAVIPHTAASALCGVTKMACLLHAFWILSRHCFDDAKLCVRVDMRSTSLNMTKMKKIQDKVQPFDFFAS